VFASTTAVACSGAEVVVVDVAVAEALALGAHALAGEVFQLLATTAVGYVICTVVEG
jgi:hypothetical protein